MIDTLAIIGLGLMGGSLGLAAKARGAAGRVTAYARRAVSREQALAEGVADAVYESPAQAVADADLVVLCTPVLTIPDLVRELQPSLAEGAIVTDVGSTKGFLVREVSEILADSPAVFVGSHPMAGSEQAGLSAARADLYDESLVIVTPTDVEAEATQRVKAFWEKVGASVAVLAPDAHDEIIARTSHLPHLVAAALTETVDREGDIAPFCGPGFRDTTRVAAGSEDVWHDIVKTNIGAIRSEVDRFGQEIATLRELLDREDLAGVRAFLAAAREKRSRFTDA
jgi:prephenate dehydrogenase